MAFIQELDMNIVCYIHEHWHNFITDGFFTFVTFLADGGIIWIAAALIMLCSRKWRPAGVILLLSLGISAVFTNLVIKNIICRPRPFNANPELSLIIDIPHGLYSFPSGHSTSSGAGAAAIMLRNKKLGIAAIVIALIIGFSRVFMAVHYTTDVLCGLIIGAVCSVIIWRFMYGSAEALLERIPPRKTKQ